MKRANWSFVSLGGWIATIVLLMLSTSATSRGQEDHNTLDAADGTPQNAVYVDAGDVGIGTETPVELLSVAGTLGLTASCGFSMHQLAWYADAD